MGFLNIIILLGALQGLIISSLLFINRAKHSQRLLAFLILVISLACLNLYFLEIGLPHQSEFWNKVSLVIPLVIAMPIGPLVFLYVRSLIEPQSHFQKKDWIHFYPILLDLIPRIVGAIYLMGHTAGWISITEAPVWMSFMDKCDMYLDIPRWLSCSIYTTLAWKSLNHASIQKIEVTTLQWARQFVYVFAGFQIIWLVHLIPYVTPSLSDELLRVVNWYPIYIPLAIMVYWLGINGYLLRAGFRGEVKNILLPAELIEETRKTLMLAMERDRLYLDPALSLNLLVQRMGIPQKTISHVLNQQMGKSFNEFVNEYRIESVKQKLLDGPHHLTITGVAFECGFNSQATFQRAFKQVTGQTPTEYLSQHAAKSA